MRLLPVILIPLLIFLAACHKKETVNLSATARPTVDSPITPTTKLSKMDKAKVTRMRAWRHSYQGYPPGQPPSIDTLNLAVSFIDDTTVRLSDNMVSYGNQILKYESYTLTDSTCSFHTHDGSTGGYTDHNLTYNWNKDKIYLSITFGGYGGAVYHNYVTID